MCLRNHFAYCILNLRSSPTVAGKSSAHSLQRNPGWHFADSGTTSSGRKFAILALQATYDSGTSLSRLYFRHLETTTRRLQNFICSHSDSVACAKDLGSRLLPL